MPDVKNQGVAELKTGDKTFKRPGFKGSEREGALDLRAGVGMEERSAGPQ